MIELLSESEHWIGVLAAIATIIGAIATIIMLFTSKKKPEVNKVTAKNGSVASGGDIRGVTITTNNPESKKQLGDSES